MILCERLTGEGGDGMLMRPISGRAPHGTMVDAPTVRYEATLRVLIDVKEDARDPDECAQIIAERAAYCAAIAYAWHSARLVSVEIVGQPSEASS